MAEGQTTGVQTEVSAESAAPGIRQYRTAGERDDRTRFASIDSAPPAYSVARSARTAPMFMAAFAVVALGLLVARDAIGSFIGSLLGQVGGSPGSTPLSYVIVAFFVAFFVAYAALAAGTAWRRLRFGVLVILLLVLVAVAIELVAGAVIGPNNAEVVEVAANLGLAYAGMTILSGAIIATHRLPEAVVVETIRRRSPRYGITLVVSVVVAATVAWLVAQAAADAMAWLRDLALLGGILPGIVLFRLLVNVQWFAIARAELRQRVAARDMASVAFIVPAFNEEDSVADCVRAIDSAATQHPGRTRIYVVDNGSADDTVNRARAALLTCRTASGTVIDCPEPGKAYALNRGLGAVDEDIVIRVDADTQVEPDVIGRVLGHLSLPEVGAVGGMPIPRDQNSVFAPLRLIEVFERIGFVRVGTNAIDSVMVAPGTLAAYPRNVLYALDGFMTGINGEDTDMTIRIGRLGYRVVTDPAIRVRSEVPSSVRHLREQRIRWSRSMYHVLAQHLSAIRMRQGPRGIAAIPWALVHLPRQPMLIPIAIFSLLVAIVDPTLLPLNGGAAILAIILGLQLLITLGVLAANRRLDLVQYLPDYVGFRVLRSYFALESLFTLTMDPAAETLPVSQPTSAPATMEQAGSS